MSENDALVELRTFGFLQEAELAASALEASGIDCTLREQFVSGAHPELTGALGGVALLVPRGELEAAREVLDTPQEMALDSSDDAGAVCAGCGRELRGATATCPSCNALPDRPATTTKRTRWALVKFKIWIIVATLILMAAPAIWRRVAELPENLVAGALYGLLALAAAVVIVRGLSSWSDRRL